MARLFTVALVAGAIGFAQTPPVFRVPVRVVSAPTAVVSHDGKLIRGLEAGQFRLSDNGRRQDIRVDLVEEPVSLAIVVQTNRAARARLAELRRSASLIETSVLGETGEVSLTTFDDEVREVLAFTGTTSLIDKAFSSIAVRGYDSHCLDAVLSAAQGLAVRPTARRRVILLITQARDMGSTAKLNEVLTALEVNNITVYSLAITGNGRELMRNTVSLRGNNAPDVGFTGGLDLLTLIPEIYRDVKAAAGKDAVTISTVETGGRRMPFGNLRDLESAVAAIGEELHTEYLLSYTPADAEPGYHQIRVEVDVAGAAVRTRPGYYVATPDGR
jgi:VWFA-related protein